MNTTCLDGSSINISIYDWVYYFGWQTDKNLIGSEKVAAKSRSTLLQVWFWYETAKFEPLNSDIFESQPWQYVTSFDVYIFSITQLIVERLDTVLAPPIFLLGVCPCVAMEPICKNINCYSSFVSIIQNVVYYISCNKKI